MFIASREKDAGGYVNAEMLSEVITSHALRQRLVAVG